MHPSPGRRRAAFPFLMLALTASAAAPAPARSQGIDVPGYRQLEAVEPMAGPGAAGTDFSANAPSLAGLTLLATIPAPNSPRRGYQVQAQCTAGLRVAFDDAAGTLTPTIVVLGGAATEGAQGGSLDMAGMPHTGRIRIYSSDASCRMAARAW